MLTSGASRRRLASVARMMRRIFCLGDVRARVSSDGSRSYFL